jgi:very-short-patch-repair endonuclease
MAGKKHSKVLRLAREKLQDALNSLDAWPADWLALDFLSLDHGVAIRLRDGQHADVDTAVHEADCTCRLESATGMRLLWFSPQEVLDDLNDVLARVSEAVGEAEGCDSEEEWEGDEEEVGCPIFAPVNLPPTCTFCRNAEGWEF